MKLTHYFLATATVLTLAGFAHAGIAVDPIQNGNDFTSFVNGWMLGWSFTPNADINVTQLGYYDLDGNGLGGSHEVGIWQNRGALLGSATVSAGTVDPILDGFRYVTTPSISLLAGTTYVIGALEPKGSDNDALTTQNHGGLASFTTAPEISYIGPRDVFTTSFSRPDGDMVGFTAGVFGPNFQFDLATVPEPGTALFGLVLMGATTIRRRRA